MDHGLTGVLDVCSSTQKQTSWNAVGMFVKGQKRTLINRPYQSLAAGCRDKAMGACCRGMADDSDHYTDVDVVLSMLKAVYCRDGAEGAVQAAKHMIAAAAALLTCEHGPNETRRILQIVGEAQGKAS